MNSVGLVPFHCRRRIGAGCRLALVMVLIFSLRGGYAAADQPSPAAATSILLIGHQPDHPPGTHLYLTECELLANCLRQLPGVQAVVSDGWPADGKLLEGVDAIVLYASPGADLLLGGPQAEQVERLLSGGTGLVALHWATGAHGQTETAVGKRYRALLGGLFSFAYSGLKITDGRVEQVRKAHPICRGWSDFDLHDEFYLDLKFLPAAQPILRVSVDGQEQTVAWVYERPGGGRSYGNTLGHFHALFQQPEFRRMLLNGILWAAHYEVPENGAPCDPGS